ncbi:sigma-70 family RNA polymerase sigma factor [Thermogutta sp.]|uniref:RNA polymerase sigma factor n=1 Tax=Thermogutta sp. TaxID=1962930 RepID=UPI0025E882C2|nr:sigma-70 family RNA polymerase sigma factor [Thermogutta sp.]
MNRPEQSEQVFIERIRAKDPVAWEQLIATYEGRLLAFLEPRVEDRATAEDLVQETFTGFLRSLPHFDDSRSLEKWLFAIAANKLKDHLRRDRRLQSLMVSSEEHRSSQIPVPAKARGPSTILDSRERRTQREALLVTILGEELDRLRQNAEWTRLACLELLFVGGFRNKEAAEILGISEQQVANWKHDFQSRLKRHLDAARENGIVF